MFTDTARRVIAGGGWGIVVFASVLLLAACGGGGGGGAGVLPQTPERATQPQTPQNIAFGVALRGGGAVMADFKAPRDANGDYVVQPMTAAVSVSYRYTIIYLTITVREPITVRNNPDVPVITLEGGRIVPEDEAPTEAPVDETPAPPQDETPPPEPPAQDPPQTPVNNDPPDEGANPPPDSTPPDEGGAQLPVSPPVNNDPPDEGANPPQTPVNNDPPEDNTPPDEGVTPPSVEPPPPPVTQPDPPPSRFHPGIPQYRTLGGGVVAIKAEAAHSAGYFGQGVTVAVLDAQFTIHGESSSIWADELNLLPSSPDAAGYTRSRYANSGQLQKRAAHIIGAARNSVGIDGIAPSVKIMPLRDRAPHVRTGPSGQDYPNYEHVSWGGTHGGLSTAFNYAVSNGAHIIHNSLQDVVEVEASFGFFKVPGHMGLVEWTPPPGIGRDFLWRMGDRPIGDALHDSDVVAVWDAGDQGWHEGGYVEVQSSHRGFPTTRYVTPEYIINSNSWMQVNSRFRGNVVGLTTANIPSHYAWGPYYDSKLLGKWLVVVAVDQNNNNTIASFSNGCGKTRAWCLAAPGVRVFDEAGTTVGLTSYTPRTTPGDHETRYYEYAKYGNGTPYAAAHVVGALALLKSKYPNMPMSVVAQILLSTATDLGAAGVDGVYGHGMVNVSAAMAAQADARYVSPNASQGSFGASSSGGAIPGLPLERGKTQIPNALAGLGSQLREVKMAVRYLNDRYYDAPLDVDIAPRPELSAMRVVDDLWNETSDGGKAGAARFFVHKNDGDQLREAGGALGGFQVRHNWFGDAPLWSDVESSSRPFFFSSSGGRKSEVSWRMGNAGFFASRGEEKTGDYNQYGVRLWKRAGRLHLSSALSEIREEDSLLGGRFGGVLPLAAGGETRQGKVLAKFAMDGFGAADEWHLFGSYQHARTEAKVGGVVSALSGLRARGWQAGLSGRGVFRGGDVFRFAVGEETALSGGKAILRYARSSGAEVDAATQIRVNRGIRVEEREVEIKNNTRPSLSAGYGFRPTEKSRLSFGITHTPGATSQAGINYRVDF